jgi:hypothetical protein
MPSSYYDQSVELGIPSTLSTIGTETLSIRTMYESKRSSKVYHQMDQRLH